MGDYTLCDLTATNEFGVIIQNVGETTISTGDSIIVECNVDGNIITDTLVTLSDINPTDTIIYMFNETFDLSALGTHNYELNIYFDADQDALNNTVSGIFNHIEYVIDLDAINGGIDDTLEVASYPITLDAGNGFPYYTWSDFSTLQTLEVNSDGWYHVTVYNDVDCDATDSIYVYLFDGINQVLDQTSISVFPNPNRGMFKLQISNVKNSKIEFMTYTGQVISTEKVESATFVKEFDVDELPSGVYFIKVTTLNKTIIEKIVIQ
jgi:hypothetical protein